MGNDPVRRLVGTPPGRPYLMIIISSKNITIFNMSLRSAASSQGSWAFRPRTSIVCNARKEPIKSKAPQRVEYGADWYQQTRDAARPRRTVREELEYRRQANAEANNGKERKDLYTDNWDGSEYKGSQWNILTLLAALFFLVPIGGLVFAFLTYGELWG